MKLSEMDEFDIPVLPLGDTLGGEKKPVGEAEARHMFVGSEGARTA